MRSWVGVVRALFAGAVVSVFDAAIEVSAEVGAAVVSVVELSVELVVELVSVVELAIVEESVVLGTEEIWANAVEAVSF